jgi:calcineurin-like phosphoesterase family protein
MALRLLQSDVAPFHELVYLNAAPRGGTEVRRLSFERARVDGLPAELDAIIATSDLQGISPDPTTRESRLLGVAVAEELDDLAFDGVIPPTARIGIVLAGDLYSVPDANKRGGHGGVEPVWAAFADRFAWVVGVAGNHDDMSAVARTERVLPIDTELVELDGLRVGGVALITGNPDKRGRRAEDDQLARIERVTRDDPELMILHEGPAGDSHQPGNVFIRDLLQRRPVPLTICGHAHWDRPVADLGAGYVVNVDARVVILCR